MYIHIHIASSPRRCRKLATCCIGSGGVLCLVIVAVALSFTYATKSSSVLSHSQPIYGYRLEPLAYSPFNSSINLFHYKSAKGVTHGNGNDYTYNVTVCVTSCPLKTVISESVVKGGCPENRFFNNCYVHLLKHENPDEMRRTDSQYYSRYMLNQSRMTFTIIEQPHVEPVRLCITTNNNTCDHIFNNGSLRDCVAVLDFNQTNNYSREYTANMDSYYCAVWLIKEANQSVNYTITLEVVSYQLPTSGCKNFNASEFSLDLWPPRRKVATKYQDVCILVQNNAIDKGSTTLSIDVIAWPYQNLAFAFGIAASVILIVAFFVVCCI